MVCVCQTCAEAQTDTRVMMVLLWSLPFQKQSNERAFRAEAGRAQLAPGALCHVPSPWRARQGEQKSSGITKPWLGSQPKEGAPEVGGWS